MKSAKICGEHSGVCAKMDAIHATGMETRGWVIKLFTGVIILGVFNVLAVIMATMVGRAVASGH